LKNARLGVIAESLDLLVSLGWAADDERTRVGDASWTVRHRGIEVIFAGIVSLRRGRYEDESGDLVGDTEGWGVGLRIGRYAGFRYDRASVPWGARSLTWPDLEMTGWTVYADPLAILETVRK
jgi:hypothetical protein